MIRTSCLIHPTVVGEFILIYSDQLLLMSDHVNFVTRYSFSTASCFLPRDVYA